MKKENATLIKKLQQYSALAAPMLATAGFASAQVVYHDVVPDRIMTSDSPADTMLVDLNNDGTLDFIFFAVSNFAGAFRDVGVFPAGYMSSSNAIAGSGPIYNTAGGATAPLLHPYPFSAGTLIDQNIPWYKQSQLSFQSSAGNSVFFWPAMNSFYNGNYRGLWLDGADHYVPLRVVSGINTNYGWARCKAEVEATALTVKSWGIQMTSNTPIHAGEGEPTGINAPNASSDFSIFPYEGVVLVSVNDGKFSGASVKVTNMMGQTMISQALNDRLTRLDLNKFGKGIYLVSVSRGGENFSRKVSFR